MASAEVFGREWTKLLAEERRKGVQENHISRREAKQIGSYGSFPIFIKEMMLPMWKHSKGVSFEAIDGPYEQSIQMHRFKLRQLKRDDTELYCPKNVLIKQQLEEQMLARKKPARTFQIVKWTRLISNVLKWRIADLAAAEVELETQGRPVRTACHEQIRAKRFKQPEKYMCALWGFVSQDDPYGDLDDDEDEDQENGGQDKVLESIADKTLMEIGNRRKPDTRSVEKAKEGKLKEEARREELAIPTRLNADTTAEEVHELASATWMDPGLDHRSRETSGALRPGCITGTLKKDKKDDQKFIKQADALKNRNDWVLDKKHVHGRMILQRDAPYWLPPVEILVKHHQPIRNPPLQNSDGTLKLDHYKYREPSEQNSWAIRKDLQLEDIAKASLGI
jgi:hypothetical protein